MFDLIIRGDRVVTPHGVGKWDIAIKGEQIAALAAPGAFGDDAAKRVINATGKIVMPGGIDPHVHCAWHIPALEEGGEPTYTAPPSVVSKAGWTPKNGTVAEPGLVAMAPGSDVIMMPPVSVCHHVSTIGHRPSPTTSLYHLQASGLMGSPTLPKTRSEERDVLVTKESPCCIKALIAVGAV